MRITCFTFAKKSLMPMYSTATAIYKDKYDIVGLCARYNLQSISVQQTTIVIQYNVNVICRLDLRQK